MRATWYNISKWSPPVCHGYSVLFYLAWHTRLREWGPGHPEKPCRKVLDNMTPLSDISQRVMWESNDISETVSRLNIYSVVGRMRLPSDWTGLLSSRQARDKALLLRGANPFSNGTIS